MQNLTLTALRKNLFQVADKVLATGEPVVIERHGRCLALIVQPTPDTAPRRLNLDELPRRNAIIGGVENLAELKAWDISEWRELDNLG